MLDDFEPCLTSSAILKHFDEASEDEHKWNMISN